MIADRVRMDPYALALKRAVGPHSIVLDIGAATGIHSLLAAKFGAKKVYAVEPNDAIHLAKQLAVANGFDERIEFIRDVSTNIVLPEPADIVVSDLRGLLPLFGHHIPSLIDARERLMSPEAVLIPRQDTLWLALVEATQAYKDITKPWDYPYGLNMDDAKAVVLNGWTSDNTDDITSGNLLSEPKIWSILDYSSISNPNVNHSKITIMAKRDGIAHGILIWFDAELMDGIGFSNAPTRGRNAEVYGRGFFPLLKPVSISTGDMIILDISAELGGEEYRWSWHTRFYNSNNRDALRAEFDQSTSYAQRVLARNFSEGSYKLKPMLGAYGRIDRYVLGKMDGRTSLESIAQRTLTRFPDRFQNTDEAAQYVYELFQQYRD